ncbi:MAG TPA: uroporphyrinogen-III synthase [Stellaceae bacterium]|nr:uroporphyrinogen-III synthase [Stellaceae bacterium]
MIAIPKRSPPRALVTRPRAEAAALAAVLAARGIETIVEPLIEIGWRDGPLDLAGVQAVLCTSANGVRALARASGERTVPLYAVGETTAAQARSEGFAAAEGAGGDIVDLARLVGARLHPAAGRLVHIAGSAVAGDLAGELRAAGFAVERAVLYDAQPAAALTPETAAALAERSIDLALFFSPRTAAIFLRLAADAGVAGALTRVTAISISRAADAALGDLAFRGRLVAAAPTQAAVLDRINSLFAATPL